MKHNEHVDLIKKAISHKGGIWADFGSGDGAFTLALRDLAGPDVLLYSIDKDLKRLKIQEREFYNKFPGSKINFINADFTKFLQLPFLDGIIMANSLHYVKDQVIFITSLKNYLKPLGKLVLVEYNIDIRNPWVPYPLSFATFKNLAKKAEFIKPELLKKIPSSYWEEMYAAQAFAS